MKMKHIKTEAAPVSGQHTPTPWHVPSSKLTGLSENIVWNQAGQLIAACDSNVHIDAETKKANAEFIVQACNCHEELVNALELAQATIERLHRHAPGSAQGTLDVISSALNKASRE